MRQILLILSVVFSSFLVSAQEANVTAETKTQNRINPENVLIEMKAIAENIDVSAIAALPVQQNGRIKPFDTLSRESMMYISGSYSRFGLHPVQTMLSMMAFEGAPYIEWIEVRSKELRTELGYPKSKRLYSIADLEGTNLLQIAEPLLMKQKENSRLLDEREKKVIEAYQQLMLAKEITSGQMMAYAADYAFINQAHGEAGAQGPTFSENIQDKIRGYFQTITKTKSEQQTAAGTLIAEVKAQKSPDLFKHYFDKMELEVFYNKLRPFLWAAFLSLLLGLFFFMPLFKNKMSIKLVNLIYLVPVLFVALGLGIRVYITKFAPITNMYGTMIWVAFGVILFSFILFLLYKNYTLNGIALICSGLILMLTEQIPLILSPDLDPIVAVLRSNFWLSTHVTTITISYAAFTIAMVLGNIALVRVLFLKDNEAFFKEYSHYAYRMIQLGCFLLSVGIILGGIWADYSWGRFWGWDPKETWSLIANLGYLAILHARFVGWMTPFYLLAFSPLAYLLVIMAWYGVNFILAAGLHSYGFSSGGALLVGIFVSLQVILLTAAILKFKAGKNVTNLNQPEKGMY